MKSPDKRSPKSSGSDAAKYQRHKQRQSRAQRRQSEAGRGIGPIPPVADPERKLRAIESLEFFYKYYFPKTFQLPWSDDHLEVIDRLEEAKDGRGGLFALAMPRGSGKTSMLIYACLWAVMIGARRYVLFLGADEAAAAKNLRSIKTELANNERLLADFPEIVYPIACLERITQRSSGQLHNGKPTNLIWTKQEVVLPTIAGSPASGAVLQVDGLMGAVRGPRFTQPDGLTIRPDFVGLDDVQTDDSARSAYQTQTRLDLVGGAVLNLAGPDVAISGVLLGTVISPGDLMDRLLDRQAHPEWRGVRKKLVYHFPTAEKLWERYAEMRADSLRAGGDGSQATEFYRLHQAEMDEGAEVAWPARKEPDEISAVQHAMNLLYRDRKAFFCEMQNEPEDELGGDVLSADEIKQKINGRPRGQVPTSATFLVAKIDVHDKLLYWTAAAYERNFTGYVVDYGTYPDQRRRYFTLRNARVTLKHKAPKGAKTKEGAILAGLIALLVDLLGRVWLGPKGEETKIQLCLVDVGYLPDTVEEAIGRDGRTQIVIPSRGVPITASSRPMSEWKYNPGDRRGFHWGYFRRKGRRFRILEFDANAWKTFETARLSSVPGEPGSLSLFGRQPGHHQLYADHLAAEIPKEVECQGRRVQQWDNPKQTDNHWLDCTVGTLVAASFLGAELAGAMPHRRRRPRRGVRYH